MMDNLGKQYTAETQRVIGDLVSAEGSELERAATLLANSVERGGVVHVFGAGHSQLVAADATFRAGGPAWVNGILDPALSIGRGAVAATRTERMRDMADAIFEQLRPRDIDATIAISNSGVTPITVRWAELAKSFGLPVVAIISRASLTYFTSSDRNESPAAATSFPPSLLEHSNVVLDNHCPVGDATVSVAALKSPNETQRIGPTSTLANGLLFHWLAVATHDILRQRGKEVEAFRSGHMPGSSEHNKQLITRYADLIDIF